MNNTYQKHQKQRLDKFRTQFPDLYKAIKWDLDPGRADEIQSLELWTLTDGRTIYFFEDPGHGFFYSQSGEPIGEEDAGLDNGGHAVLKDAVITTLI